MSEANSRPIVLVAMGGHAFIQRDERGNIRDQEKNAVGICASLMTLIDRDYNLVITHGNGPQVGNLLLQNELTQDAVPSMPLDVLVANTEGFLGYVLQQALLNHLRARQIKRYVVTMITQVLVERDDPAFQHPSKPIGPFLTREQAEERRDRLGWKILDDAGRGWRRLVASPRPVRVVQRLMIRDSARAGHRPPAAAAEFIVRRQADNAYEDRGSHRQGPHPSVRRRRSGAEFDHPDRRAPSVRLVTASRNKALGAVTLEEIEAERAGALRQGQRAQVEAIVNS